MKVYRRSDHVNLQPKCHACPPWINTKAGDPPPRLLCKRKAKEPHKKHVNEQGHQWEVTGRNRPNRGARK